MVWLYAITAAPGPPALAGAPSESLRAVATDRLAAVVADRASAPAPSARALWEHEQVVEWLLREHTVLPMRFGSTLGDDADVRELLDARAGELSDALERVRGAVEIGVRVTWAGEESAAPQATLDRPGTAYLHGRLRSRQATDAAARRIDDRLRDLYRARRVRVAPGPPALLRGAYLVDSTAVPRFRARATAAAAELTGAQLVTTGPWPPYSFVEGEPD